MALKTTIAAALAALSLSVFAVPAAEANTNVTIGIGTPAYGPGWSCWGWPRRCGYGRPVYIAPRPVYVAPPVVYRNISCAAARNIVDRSGFNNVQPRNCTGQVYSFRATKRGYLYRVDVNARNGNIIGTRRY